VDQNKYALGPLMIIFGLPLFFKQHQSSKQSLYFHGLILSLFFSETVTFVILYVCLMQTISPSGLGGSSSQAHLS